MWYIALLLAVVSTSFTISAQRDEEPLIYVVRVPSSELEQIEYQPLELNPRDIYTKRAIPFNGGMYGKRSPMPFSGGLYGKRSILEAQRRAALPFSGGMYGKRSVGTSYDSNENQIKRGAMPFSGGMYGR